MAAASACLSTVSRAEAPDAARIRQAVSYLDGRQDEWSHFSGADRGEGGNKTSCVSCHTGVSYALARPALRPFADKPDRSTHEERMLSAARLRVAHWAELDTARFKLMYDNTDRKKSESRGTEAVLNALILARDDAAQARTSPSDDTQAAMKHLWATQTISGDDAGSWEWLNFGYQPWEGNGSRAFGAALAALAVGSAPGYLANAKDEAAVRGTRLLREYLRKQFPDESLYNRIWILKAATKFEGLISADDKQAAIRQLVSAQRADGGWALSELGDFERVDGTSQPRESEGYATGLSIHVLLGAGVPVTQPELIKAVTYLRSHQQADGSWRGRSLNKERDPKTFAGKLMSDAATAFAALALAESQSP
jgi:squalene-hopene/tetraprenyl-beta-curcumene cyclase